MFFKTYWILGQNARNLNYIKPFNNSFAKYIADSKLRTKEFLSSKWIGVPETFFIIKSHKELDNIDLGILNPPFVVKPNAWFWGKGILIFDKVDSVWNFITNDSRVFSKKDLVKHFSEILDWFYSLSWTRDKVIVEQKIELETSIDLLWKYWLPDIRLIVFNMTPVMAMLRIPTKESGWKANLHSWACWAWIDIGSGKITYLTQHDKIIKSVPWLWDIRWMTLPYWEDILTMWVALQKHTSIWYLACDIVLDKERWPLLLEVNIRPWLNLQIANKAPLLTRLKKLEWITVTSVEKWVRLWKDLFGGDLEEKVKNITWKKILGPKEFLSFVYNEKKFQYISSIQLTKAGSIIDRSFLRDVIKMPEDEIVKSVTFDCELLGEKKEIKFAVKDLDGVNIILWKNSLKWFYIDPFKYKKWDMPESQEVVRYDSRNILIRQNYESQIQKIDKALVSIDKKLVILKRITPINLFEEKLKFQSSKWEYVPTFKYNPIDLNIDDLRSDLKKIDIWDIPYASIYKRKKDEINNKLDFFSAFISWDDKGVLNYSRKIFWDVSSENLDRVRWKLMNLSKVEREKEFVSFQEIRSMINKFNHIYWINLKLSEENITSRFLISGDVVKIRPMAEVGKRELRSIIAHEIEWHYLKRVNGKKFPYKILSSWTAWYIADEEGVAIYNQNRFLSKNDKKYYSIYRGYVTLNNSLNMPYDKFLESILERYWEDYWRVFNVISRLKRWTSWFDSEGVFMKDVVYVNWYFNVLDFLEGWGNLKELYIWKVWIIDLKDFNNEDFPLRKPSDLSYPLFL